MYHLSFDRKIYTPERVFHANISTMTKSNLAHRISWDDITPGNSYLEKELESAIICVKQTSTGDYLFGHYNQFIF